MYHFFQATAKLPSKADLSNCHLEFLPETVFINEDLRSLNLRHNALKTCPIEEDIYTIGWLDDLPR
jgi:PH domain/leucine-rich repeat-containing protein phosphatase